MFKGVVWKEQMFERQRELQRRTLNLLLGTTPTDRRQYERLEAEGADSATSLPLDYAQFKRLQ
jgi:hypothetical protein